MAHRAPGRGLRAIGVLLALTCGSGCARTRDAPLRVGGETPYVRCGARPPREHAAASRGPLRVALEGRRLRIPGLPAEPLVAAFAGPAPSDGSLAPAAAGIAAAHVSAALVLGSLGDAPAEAGARLRELAALTVPVLVVAGGRDEAQALDAAFASLDGATQGHVLDLRGVAVVELGGAELLIVHGAPDGRGARSAEACGFGAAELALVRAEAGTRPPRGPRVLVSWAAPSGPVALGYEGVDVGDPRLRALSAELGARGGIFAWPVTRAGEPLGAPPSLELVVPPAAGYAVERADGRRVVPGPTLLRLTSRGPEVAAWPAAPGAPPGLP